MAVERPPLVRESARRGLLDEHHWTTRCELAAAICERIECWYNASRRHSSIQMLSPIDYENLTTAAAAA